MKHFIVVNELNDWIYTGIHNNPKEVETELKESELISEDIKYYIYETVTVNPQLTLNHETI